MRHIELLILSALSVGSHAAEVTAQTPSVVAHTVDVSGRRASLELQLSNESVVNVTLQGGDVLINGAATAHYQTGDKLENAWRAFLDSAASLGSADVVRNARHWNVPDLTGQDLAGEQAIEAALATLSSVPASTLKLPASPPPPEGRGASRGFRWTHRAPSTDEAAEPRTGFAAVGPLVAGLVGSFVALASIAFGLISFAPRQLGTISDTVHHSFIRSFFAGLFAQPLLLPALAVLIIALVLTVVGIVVVPVAVVAYAVAVAAAIVGGYLGAARALGESYLRRKMARGGAISGDIGYRSILIGLSGLLMVWLPFTLLGWIPGLGVVLLWAAVIFTWVMATAGLGATILSRAGSRTTYVRQITPQLSGELSWSTVDEIAPSQRSERSIS